MTNIEQQLKLHRFIESVKQKDFPFDTHDVDEDLDEVLGYYRSDYELTEEDKTLLKDELAKLAEAEQTKEITSIIIDNDDPILRGIKQPKESKGLRKW